VLDTLLLLTLDDTDGPIIHVYVAFAEIQTETIELSLWYL